MLQRYNYVNINQSAISYTTWKTFYQQTHDENGFIEGFLTSNEVKELIDTGYLVKIFQILPKSKRGWTRGKIEYKQNLIQLLKEYTFPKPMPEDVFPKYHIDADQGYLMLATAGTGN